MSQITASTIMPLITALPADELHVLRRQINKLLGPETSKKQTKREPFKNLPQKFRPGNTEMLIAEIMNPVLK